MHLDVDVLDDALMPAVDYRHPGGITWQEAAEILGGLLTSDRARGLEVTIFNPRLDPDASIAQRLSDLITNTVLRRAARRRWTFAPAPAAITDDGHLGRIPRSTHRSDAPVTTHSPLVDATAAELVAQAPEPGISGERTAGRPA